MAEFSVHQVPKSETEMLDLMASRPGCWEYLLFGYYLRAGIAAREVKWRDYSLGYTMSSGPRIPLDEVGNAVSERMSRVTPLASAIERIIGATAQELAFGKPGEPGDPDMIQHMADRFTQVYEGLLDWADEFRSLRFGEDTTLGDDAAELVAQPIAACRHFVSDYIDQVEAMLAKLSTEPEEPVRLTFAITFEFNESASARLIAETKRLRSLA